MRQGNLSERYLKNSVFKNIQKTDKTMVIGAGIGNDYSLIEDREGHKDMEQVNSKHLFESGLVTSDGVGESPQIAFYKAYNNFCCSLGSCEYARISFFLPEKCKASQIKAYSDTFAELAKDKEIQIVGGNSLVSSSFQNPTFQVILFGKASDTYCPQKKAIRPGFEIVFVGYTGILGTNLLIEANQKDLSERFTADFLKSAEFSPEKYSVQEAVQTVIEKELFSKCNICYIHDVSYGGIYLALWQLGECVGKGFLVENKQILIRQETVEICEYLNCNPYYLDGTGGVLFVCENGGALVKTLQEKKIAARTIGHITQDKERFVKITAKDIRTLSPEIEESE